MGGGGEGFSKHDVRSHTLFRGDKTQARAREWMRDRERARESGWVGVCCGGLVCEGKERTQQRHNRSFVRSLSLRALPRLPHPPLPAMAAPPRRGPLLLRSYDVVRRAGEGDTGQLGEWWCSARRGAKERGTRAPAPGCGRMVATRGEAWRRVGARGQRSATDTPRIVPRGTTTQLTHPPPPPNPHTQASSGVSVARPSPRAVPRGRTAAATTAPRASGRPRRVTTTATTTATTTPTAARCQSAWLPSRGSRQLTARGRPTQPPRAAPGAARRRRPPPNVPPHPC